MLEEIMAEINNYFVPQSAELVEYTIQGGAISPSVGAQAGDRFYICGSRRNDGVYTWHDDVIGTDDDERIPPVNQGGQETIKAAGLQDETFAGTIRLCAVPPAVLRLSGEIKQWVATYGEQLASPLQGETFNGYSYTLRSGSGANGGGALTWRDCPAARELERWRRPSIC